MCVKKQKKMKRKFFSIDVSIEVPPESKTGGKHLTEDEENEFRQVQGLIKTFERREKETKSIQSFRFVLE